MTTKTKTLGESNGWTVPLMRINLIIVPIFLTAVLSLNVWIVKAIYRAETDRATDVAEVKSMKDRMDRWYEAGPRYSATQAAADLAPIIYTLKDHDRRLTSLEQKP